MRVKTLQCLRVGRYQAGLLANAFKCVVLAGVCAFAVQLHAQPSGLPDSKFWITDGPVYAILATNNTVYVGGDFSYVGPRTGPAAAFDVATGGFKGSPPNIYGTVKAVVSDGAGGWFIGGTFTGIGELAVTNLAHLQADLTLDIGWSTGLNGSSVNALALDSGRLYIGGAFSRINGQALSGGLVAVSSAKPGVIAWNPLLSGTVNALQVAGGIVYAGGSFYSVGNSNLQNLAAISTTTALATAFNPSAVDSPIYALSVTATNIYVGGQFTTIGTKSKNHLAALDLNVGLANSWNPNPNGIVRALVVTSSNAFVGGDFTTISIANHRGFASIGLTGPGTAKSLDLALQSVGTANLVRSIIVQGNSLYVGGQFTNALGAPHYLVVGLDIPSSLPLATPLGTDFNGAAGQPFGANALASANGKVFVGGDFQSLGGVPRGRAAAFSLTSGAALPWAPSFDFPVYSLAYGSNMVYLGGSFTNYNTTNSIPSVGNGLAAVNPINGNPIKFFNFLGTNISGSVTIDTLAISSNALYAGGLFSGVGSQLRKNLAALDPSSGSLLTGFNANLVGGYAGVSSILLAGTNLYVGGDFTTVNALAIPRLAALSPDNGLPIGWTPTPNQPVLGLSASADTLHVIGAFTTVNPDGNGALTLNHYASFSLADNSLVPIDAALSPYASASAVAATETAIYIGGQFTSIGGNFIQNIADLSTIDGSAFAWNPFPDQNPSVITLTDDYAFMGGIFRFLGQSPTNEVFAFFAAFDRPPQMHIKGVTGGNVQIDFSTGDYNDAVVQEATNFLGSSWTDIQTYSPGFPQTLVLPRTTTQSFFRVITH